MERDYINEIIKMEFKSEILSRRLGGFKLHTLVERLEPQHEVIVCEDGDMYIDHELYTPIDQEALWCQAFTEVMPPMF